MQPYPWIVLLHVVGAIVFVMCHGVSIFVLAELRQQRERARIEALLDLSARSLSGLYIGLLLLLVGGIWAAIYGDWFKFAWPWVALATFMAIAVAMYLIATPYFKRLRIAVGQRAMGYPKSEPDPVPLPEAEIVALAAGSPITALMAIGLGGLLVILWLMVVKPF